MNDTMTARAARWCEAAGIPPPDEVEDDETGVTMSWWLPGDNDFDAECRRRIRRDRQREPDRRDQGGDGMSYEPKPGEFRHYNVNPCAGCGAPPTANQFVIPSGDGTARIFCVSCASRANQWLVSQRDETDTNERGGKQSRIGSRMSLFPVSVLIAIFDVLHSGAAKYGEGNWERISIRDHLDHAYRHMNLWRAGDRSEPHLIHAICRLVFAAYLAMKEAGE